MRREFILVLLGIVCISTLSSLMSGYVQTETDKLLLDTVVGQVGSGNFSYWQLGHTGPLLIELTSLSGDADLYVADHIRPGYEVHQNSFSSITCGPDIVYVPADFVRPIGIGVYGHWSHEISEYSIQVFLDTSAVMSEDEIGDGERAYRPSTDKHEPEKKRSKERAVARKSDDEEKPRLLKLLNILDMIFDMFVL